MKNTVPSYIRWNRSDSARLSSAVRQFNRKVIELDMLTGENYLPEIKDYKEVKERIVSRKELNRIIKSLKRFTKEKEQQRVVTEGGQELTRWEQKEINLAERRATRTLTREKFNILSSRKSIGMGDKRVKEIESTLESFKNLRTQKGRDFQRVKERVLTEGTTDRELYKAKVFRDNFFEALSHLKNYDNYELLKSELEKISNPITFFNKIKDNDILMDIFTWYMGDDGSIKIYGAYESVQEAFNSGIEQQGYTLEIPNIAES